MSNSEKVSEDFSTSLIKFNKMNDIKNSIPKEMRYRISNNMHNKSMNQILKELEEMKQYILSKYNEGNN